MTPKRRRGPPVQRTWPKFLLIALTVATVVLAGVAVLNLGSQSASTADTPPPAEVVSTPVATAAAAPVAAQTRALGALSATAAWRTSATGSCPAAPVTLEYTTDGGATWAASASASAAGVSALLSLGLSADGSAQAVGQLNAGCAPALFTTTARADRWTPAVGVEQEWYIVPGAPSSVNSPGGVRATPCAAVIAVDAATADAAAVLCDNERIMRTEDGGATWDGGLYVPGARTFVASASGYLLATVGREDCAGVRLVVVYPSAAPADGSASACRVTAADTSQVSMSLAGENLWLWTGDEFAVTADRGVSWQ
jgi:hypothetical protein